MMGAPASPSGSRASTEPVPVSAASGLDPSRKVVHALKTWPVFYHAVSRGEKNFEVRRDDRGFQRGDVLKLEYFNPKRQWAQGLYPPIYRVVTYVLSGGQFGIDGGFVVMGLSAIAMEARQGGDGETRLHPKDDSAAPSGDRP